MNAGTAISLQNVSKSYRIWEAPSGRITTPCWESLSSIFPAESGAKRWLKARAARN